MKSCGNRRRITRSFLTGLVGAAAGFAAAAQPAFAGEGRPASSGQAQTTAGANAPQQPAEQPAAVPESDAGMTVYIDPKTGAVLTEPAPDRTPLRLTPQERNALSTSHQGLVQVPSSVPGGGVKLDLQGRFQSPMIGTIGPDGKVRLQHLPRPTESPEQK
jgi:hypothetical protein